MRVSHETIYRSLFIQARGALKEELVKHPRSQRRIRRSQHSSVHRQRPFFVSGLRFSVSGITYGQGAAARTCIGIS